MAYRANFFIQTIESVLGMATALGAVYVIFAQTDTLAGWHQVELISLLGIYFVILGSINLMISPSLNKFMQDIVDGKLDFTLIKPRDTQLLISVQEFRVWKLLDIIMGLAVMTYGLAEKTSTGGWQDAVMFSLALTTAAIIIYSE